jgi:hypothetical protein
MASPPAANDGRACPASPSGSPLCGRAAATLASAASLAATGGPQQRPAEGRPLRARRARPPPTGGEQETAGLWPTGDSVSPSVSVLSVSGHTWTDTDTMGLKMEMRARKSGDAGALEWRCGRVGVDMRARWSGDVGA